MKKLWKHKGREYWGNYEKIRGKRRIKFVDRKTGKESKPFTSHEAAKKAGFVATKQKLSKAVCAFLKNAKGAKRYSR